MGKNHDEGQGASSQLDLEIIAEGSFGSSPDDHSPRVLLLSVEDDRVHQVYGVHSKRQARDLIRKLRVRVTPASQRKVQEHLEKSSELPDETSVPHFELPPGAVGPFMYFFVVAEERVEEYDDEEDGEEDEATEALSDTTPSHTGVFRTVVPALRTGEVVETANTQPTTDVVPTRFLRDFSTILGIGEE